MGQSNKQMRTTRYGWSLIRIPNRHAVSNSVILALFALIVIVVAGGVVLGYNFGNSSANQQSNGPIQNQINNIQNQVAVLKGNLTSLQNRSSSLPVIHQTPQTRNIKVEWLNTLNSGQDRFFLPAITVNQGDTIAITFVSNDTDAHTFTLESPYSFQINATVPGTRNYLNGKNFTSSATDNSPGVKVFGTPGNVTGTGSFVAKYSGIFEYFCIYHVQLGMFGYLIVLPNAGYNNTIQQQTSNSTAGVSIDIVPNAGSNTSSPGYSLPTVTLVIGVNNTVTWSNKDNLPHTVTADDGSFSSGNLNPTDQFSWTFLKPGTYSYHCSYHPWMKATVIVKSS
jgi:plastocyanin